jgi:hypothetical protein
VARAAAARVALAAVAAAALLAACGPTGDVIVSGRFSPEVPVSLQNLTVPDGRYVVSYALEVFVASRSGTVELLCGVEDTTGRLADLPGLVQTVTSGRWVSIDGSDTFELPDLTMGVRCYPDRDVSLQVVVRRVELSAEPAD